MHQQSHRTDPAIPANAIAGTDTISEAQSASQLVAATAAALAAAYIQPPAATSVPEPSSSPAPPIPARSSLSQLGLPGGPGLLPVSSMTGASAADSSAENTPRSSVPPSPDISGRDLQAIPLLQPNSSRPSSSEIRSSQQQPQPQGSPTAPGRPPRPVYSRQGSGTGTPLSPGSFRRADTGSAPSTLTSPLIISRPLQMQAAGTAVPSTAASSSSNSAAVSLRNSPHLGAMNQPAGASAVPSAVAILAPPPAASPTPSSQSQIAGNTPVASSNSVNGDAVPFLIKNLDTGESCDLSVAPAVFPEVERAMTLKALESSLAAKKTAVAAVQTATATTAATTGGATDHKEVAEKKEKLGFLSRIKKAFHINDEDGNTSSTNNSSSGISTAALAAAVTVKVKTKHRSYQDFTDVRHVQSLTHHAGPVWTVSISTSGEYLATGGQDSIVRVWAVMGSKDAKDFDDKLRIAQAHQEMTNPRDFPTSVNVTNATRPTGWDSSNANAPTSTSAASVGNIEVTVVNGVSPVSPAAAAGLDPSIAGSGSTPIEVPDFDVDFNAEAGTRPIVYPLPFRSYAGHKADVIDLAWSKANFLLSASIDKTVRLWHVSRQKCLCVFQHADFVTAVSFHPVEDRYFVSGSFDKKLRIWNIPEHRVVEWAQTANIITAAAFSPSGNMAVAGLYNGSCVFYQTDGLKYFTQVDAKNRKGKNRKGKKVTGMQFAPDGRTMLVTTNDSRIRLYDLSDYSMLAKFKGTENDELQIRAWFSPDGRQVICGGENQQVVVWSAAEYMGLSSDGGISTNNNNNGAAMNGAAASVSANAGNNATGMLSPSSSSSGGSSSGLNSSSNAVAASSSSSSISSVKPDVKCDSYECFRAFNDTCTSAQFLPPQSLRLCASTCPNEAAAQQVRHIIVAAGYQGEVKFFENRGTRQKC
jgi:WD40 repeat protein